MDKGLLAYGIGVKPTARMDVGVPFSYMNGKFIVNHTMENKYHLRIFCHATRKIIFQKQDSGKYMASIMKESV